MEITDESEHVMVEILGNQRINENNFNVIKEWDHCLRGGDRYMTCQRRHIQKVPPLLLEGETGLRNRKYYEPAVVSLGPYHYKQARFAQAEEYKLIILEEFCLNTGKTIDLLYNKVFEVAHEARKCYIDGSTDAFDDVEFNQMMLRDGCFVLFFIDCTSRIHSRLLLYYEYFGAIGYAKITGDILLLENQVPFVVLEILLKLRFPNDNINGEDALNRFFNYLNYGVAKNSEKKVLGNNQQRPLHLLELYRSHFISFSVSLDPLPPSLTLSSKDANSDMEYEYNYIKRSEWSPSATELKSKWIFLRRNLDDEMTFQSYRFYGEFKLAPRVVSYNTKAIFLNMIAYEMCPHNPNDFRIFTYVLLMKMLISQPEDVKELRNSGVLLHNLGHDEEVVKMYSEIEVPPVTNLYMFDGIKRVIENHGNNKYKTWVGELITDHFSSPWKTLALLAAVALLFTSFLQTYFSAK